MTGLTKSTKYENKILGPENVQTGMATLERFLIVGSRPVSKRVCSQLSATWEVGLSALNPFFSGPICHINT